MMRTIIQSPSVLKLQWGHTVVVCGSIVPVMLVSKEKGGGGLSYHIDLTIWRGGLSFSCWSPWKISTNGTKALCLPG